MHKAAIDRVEGVTEESPRLRLAFEVDDSAAVAEDLTAAGAQVIAPPTMTPWRSLNARLSAPADLQITLFQETVNARRAVGARGVQREAVASFGRWTGVLELPSATLLVQRKPCRWSSDASTPP